MPGSPQGPDQLRGQRALLIGATSGIGLACAERFLQAGAAHLAIVGRNSDRGLKACEGLRERAPHANIRFVQGDANRADEAARIYNQARSEIGGVDILVTSTASSHVPRLLFDIDPSDIPAILMDQALAPLLMSRLVLPDMRAQRSGVILNVASDAAKVPTPGETIIGAAMAAIVCFTRTLAMEAKRDGVRANAITPSLVSGTLVYDRLMADPFSERLFGKAAKLAALGVVTADDVADLVLFLAGPGAARITGQAISPNGGISAA